jgi:cell division inhibitor SulA/protein ImuA
MGSNDLLDSDELRGRIWRGTDARSAQVALPTGFAALDRYLPGGGWPLGPLIEVFVERYGVGELSLLMPALAALTDGGGSRASSRKWVAWIAPPFVPYAPALQQRASRKGMFTEAAREVLWTVEQHSLGLDLRRVGLARAADPSRCGV